MGIGISFTGKKKGGFLSKKIKADELISSVRELSEKYGYTFEYNSEQESFLVEFCPTGYIELCLRNGKVEGDSQTNITGPGFHKTVADFISDLSNSMNLNLKVDDETSYWVKRDFNKLQAEHVDWLTALCDKMLEDNETSLMISWPIDGWKPTSKENIITPMGSYTSKHIKYIFTEGDMVEFAKEYFIWYNSTKDSYYYRGVSLYLMWNEFSWVKPRNSDEKELANNILKYLEMARKEDINLRLPLKEYEEIAELIGKKSTLEGPSFEFHTNIGYRRNDIVVPFPGGWEAILPGDFIVEAEEEGYVYWNEKCNFRLSSYNIENEKDAINIFDSSTEESNTLSYEINGYKHKAEYQLVVEEDGTSYWVLQGEILGCNKLAITTITWQDERLTEWATDVFKKIKNVSA
jgi:hypothetical protein